ncbi:MAG: hypothetical protein IJS61_05900 [Firmicutes bacterium]|nr:hypothetical protein [Bacillota bacterium]
MMPFFTFSTLSRSFFALCALLLCLANIVNVVLAVARKNRRLMFFSLPLFIAIYFMWQAIFDLSLFGTGESASNFAKTLCKLPITLWLTAFLFITIETIIILRANIIYNKSTVTPNSIKIYLDNLPCGVCCWKKNGMIIFSNICMNRLCKALTNEPLMNGNQFLNTLKENIVTIDNKVWRFSRRSINIEGEELFEMTASDITLEYEKTKALEKEKEELSKLNLKLSQYFLDIDDTVRREEILQAKIHIHDEMNKLMLLGKNVSGKDPKAMDNILCLYEKNALLLYAEIDVSSSKDLTSIKELADTLNILLIWQNNMCEKLSELQQELFFAVAREAVTNAVKHALAKTMCISFSETEEYIYCSFTNDGVPPIKKAEFTGGLKNLYILAQEQGVSVSTKQDKDFTLTLGFPKYPKNISQIADVKFF